MSSPYASGPATRGVAVTPSDSVNLTYVTRALWVGGAGNVAVILDDDPSTAVVLQGVPAGTLLPLAVRRVNSTSTTATAMVALT